MLVEIHDDLLWLGNMFDARDPRPLFDLGIKAVVDLAYEELPAQLPRQLVYCRFPLNDGGGNDQTLVIQAMQTVVDMVGRGTKTLLACSAGLSRSPTIATFSLATLTGEDPAVILARIGELKPLEVNGALWQEVSRAAPLVRALSD